MQFMNNLKTGFSVAKKVSEQYDEEIIRNRAALNSLIETIKFCGIQNLSLRGHRDSGTVKPNGEFPEENDGSFRMLLRFRIKSGDTMLQNHLRDSGLKTQYTSWRFLNETLNIISNMIKESISKAVNLASVWCIMADETTDLSNREQLVIVVRYCTETSGKYVVVEDPICLLDVFEELRGKVDTNEIRMSGANISKVILDKVKALDLPMAHLIAQSYDGAASMSSERVGVAAKVREVSPLAQYFHCVNHGLNLATTKVNQVAIVRNALGTMENIITFITNGAKRDCILKIAQSENDDTKKRKLIKLCQTRFVERHIAVDRFCEQVESIYSALNIMSNWQDPKTSSNATNLLLAMERSDFIVGLKVMYKLSSLLRPLSISLQAKGADLVHALDLIKVVQDTMVQERDSGFDQMFQEAQLLAEKLDTEITIPRLSKGKSVYRSTAGGESVESYYQVNAYKPAFNAVLQERFKDHQKKSMSLVLLLPKNCRNYQNSDEEARKDTLEKLKDAFSLYEPLLDDSTSQDQFIAEYKVWSRMWKNDAESTPDSAISTLNACALSSFPSIHKLLEILATLPISTAEAERQFSRVKRTLTALRSSMKESRLEALILIDAHRNTLPDNESIIERFRLSSKRRMEFGLKI